MIKLQVIGHLGKDCVVNTVNGRSVINFSVAHSERFKDASGNQQERTIWVECAYWTDRTAISPYLKKGQLVFAEGSPEVRAYQTNDGRQGASLTMRIQSVQLLGGRTEGEATGGYNTAPVASVPMPPQTSPSPTDTEIGAGGSVDDLPF